MTFNDMVAQLAHISWSALMVDSIGARLSGEKAISIVLGFAFAKEAIESIWGVWEPVQPWSSGLEDIAFWIAGAGLGYLLLKYLWKRQ